MTIYKAQVHLASISALPRDDVVNTLYFFRASDATGAQLDQLGDDISNFYLTDSGTQAAPLKSYLAHDRDYGTNKCRVDFYLMPATPGRTGPPVRSRTFTLGSPGTVQNLPQQDAVVLSFHGDLSGVTFPARHRGRIFLGPLNVTSMEEAAGGTAAQTVAALLQQDMGKAASHWLGSVAAGHGNSWAVWSHTDWASHTVVGGWVDDRFDTQRRRLERTSGRTTYTV